MAPSPVIWQSVVPTLGTIGMGGPGCIYVLVLLPGFPLSPFETRRSPRRPQILLPRHPPWFCATGLHQEPSTLGNICRRLPIVTSSSLQTYTAGLPSRDLFSLFQQTFSRPSWRSALKSGRPLYGSVFSRHTERASLETDPRQRHHPQVSQTPRLPQTHNRINPIIFRRRVPKSDCSLYDRRSLAHRRLRVSPGSSEIWLQHVWPTMTWRTSPPRYPTWKPVWGSRP